MLSSLHIENYALIKESDIQFDDGFVVITGETGAGKSILLGALGLLLGQRADSRVLHDDQRKCVVEALFELRGMDLHSLFADADVDYSDDGTVIVRRELLPSGKSRAFVNDTPVPLAFLKSLGTRLIDIHSQHETLLLGDSTFRLRLVDSLGDGGEAMKKYSEVYAHYATQKRHLEQLTAEEARNKKDLDYNRFLYDELEQAHLHGGEQEELEEESALLANAEEIKQLLMQCGEVCDGGDDSTMQRLVQCRTLMGKAAAHHKEVAALHERWESALIELRDIADSVAAIGEGISYSPERQAEVEERLDLLNRLEQKHGVNTVEGLMKKRDELDALISHAADVDDSICAVMEEVDKAYERVRRAGDALTRVRRQGAKRLEQQTAPLLADLGMAAARMEARVEAAPQYGETGNDRVALLFNANKGGGLHDMAEVASGGELSRLMLAIKALTSEATLLPTVIFDEIDSGVSGDVSVKVGRIMQRMSHGMQVIAITHLPQIAARARQHYKVYKQDDASTTVSRIRQLDDNERRHEIAVMLSSEPPTEAALQTAQELMQQ